MTPPNATAQAVKELNTIFEAYTVKQNALRLIVSTLGTYEGNDPLAIRILDIAKQASDFDPLSNS